MVQVSHRVVRQEQNYCSQPYTTLRTFSDELHVLDEGRLTRVAIKEASVARHFALVTLSVGSCGFVRTCMRLDAHDVEGCTVSTSLYSRHRSCSFRPHYLFASPRRNHLLGKLISGLSVGLHSARTSMSHAHSCMPCAFIWHAKQKCAVHV